MDSSKYCLVTGASSGIGKEVAIGLAKAGAHVMMVSRDRAKGEAALKDVKDQSGSTNIDLVFADLSSQQSIRQLAQEVQQKFPKLNVLINNAGVFNTNRTLTSDGIETTLATNFIAPILLTELLLDLLKRNAPARIINVSSNAHRMNTISFDDLQFEKRKFGFFKAYAQSKLLLNIASFTLAKSLQGSGVTLNCIHPGAVRTGLGSNNANNFLMKLIDKLIKLSFISAKQSASYVLDLALSPKWNNTSGKYISKDKVEIPSDASLDSINSDKVKKIFAKLTHMQ